MVSKQCAPGGTQVTLQYRGRRLGHPMFKISARITPTAALQVQHQIGLGVSSELTYRFDGCDLRVAVHSRRDGGLQSQPAEIGKVLPADHQPNHRVVIDGRSR